MSASLRNSNTVRRPDRLRVDPAPLTFTAFAKPSFLGLLGAIDLAIAHDGQARGEHAEEI